VNCRDIKARIGTKCEIPQPHYPIAGPDGHASPGPCSGPIEADEAVGLVGAAACPVLQTQVGSPCRLQSLFLPRSAFPAP